MKYSLNEDTFGNAIKRGMDSQGGDEIQALEMDDDSLKNYKGDVEKALDRALRANRATLKRGSRDFQSVLLVGRGGVGKTARVEQWCEDNKLTLLTKDIKTMDASDFGGIYHPNADVTKAINLPNSTFDPLDRPNSVLFLDEYNRANAQLRGTILQLVNNHVIPDSSQPDGLKFFPNLLLVVAAMNPVNDDTMGTYNADPLDAAELSRFAIKNIVGDKISQMQFYKNRLFAPKENDDPEEALENKRRLALAMELLRDKDFEFDDDEEEAFLVSKQMPILNPRSMTRLLLSTDGTKEDLLDAWNDFCNPRKKQTVERILADYVDVDDKANSVFKTPFKEVSADWKKLDNYMRNM